MHIEFSVGTQRKKMGNPLFIKGFTPWNKTIGIMNVCPKCGKIVRRKPSHAHNIYCSIRCAADVLKVGKKLSAEHKKKVGENRIGKASGKNHYRWNPDRRLVAKNQRNDGEYKQWSISVRKRDKNKCQLWDNNCQGYMIIHHILPWAQYPEQRYKLINGIVLCQYHHPRKREDETRLIPILQKLVGSNNY